ncbi:reverse transcriptase domain-containing protein [Tanacetum coccineum]
MPIAVHNIYSFYESESSESESEDLSDIDIETLTLEQYLALNRNNSHVGVKRPEIEKSIFFEIKSQLLRELRENTFSGVKTKDAMEHLRKILEIASLFNTPGISGNDIMLRIFPLTLTGAAKRWLGRTPSDLMKTWDELKQECTMKLEPPQETPKLETFFEKVKKRIMKTQATEEKLRKKLECEPVNTTLVNDIRKTPEYTRNLQELEKDPGSFVLPCVIGNTMVSNALADLGASISEMPLSMFKRLGLGNPRSVNMVIEMADRLMQSQKE